MSVSPGLHPPGRYPTRRATAGSLARRAVLVPREPDQRGLTSSPDPRRRSSITTLRRGRTVSARSVNAVKSSDLSCGLDVTPRRGLGLRTAAGALWRRRLRRGDLGPGRGEPGVAPLFVAVGALWGWACSTSSEARSAGRAQQSVVDAASDVGASPGRAHHDVAEGGRGVTCLLKIARWNCDQESAPPPGARGREGGRRRPQHASGRAPGELAAQ